MTYHPSLKPDHFLIGLSTHKNMSQLTSGFSDNPRAVQGEVWVINGISQTVCWYCIVEIRGRVKKSLQPSFFSSHGCIYTKVAVSTSSMNLCLPCHVTWTVLHAWLHYAISIKTMHFGHYQLRQIGGKFELRENHVVAF